MAGILILSLGFWRSLPDPLFKDPFSTVVFDRDGELLGARIARDGQWRFPQPDSVPDKFEICILNFEDQYFYFHPGVNPLSLLRALYQNFKAREIVSGGSTLSMQVIRLSRKGKKRSVLEKLIEIVLTLRLELRFSKTEILNLYAGNAPFGGNVVGIETASWRYFDRNPENLSWAETAMLAVLPNSPALIHPGRNRENLFEKRNRLLGRLFEKEIIDKQTYQLSILEDIPENPHPLPNSAYHLTQYFEQNESHNRINSTIDKDLQAKINDILSVHKSSLYANQVHNAACLVVDATNSEILAYIGNIRNPDKPEYGGDVDVIHSRRSSGSILKPFLYAEMQYRGEILPNTLIPDIPTRFRGYSPKNYQRDYDGVVSASNSLARSLNVPSVRMLQDYGQQRFLDDLHQLGFTTMNYSSEHYGLSLILGGAETCLWDLAKVYTSFSRVLNSYNHSGGFYFDKDWQEIKIEKSLHKQTPAIAKEQGKIGAGSVWLTFEAMRKVNRPETESGWENFTSPRRVAWKTGTSFGFRDGWAVACMPEFTVAVWTGNASGEGRPGLTGINSAAPILFDILNILPSTTWYEVPYDDLRKTIVCQKSGHKAGRNCEETDTVWVSPAGLNTTACPYHRMIHLDEEKKFRVNAGCYPVNKMIQEKWFVLPPAQEWFHLKKNSSFKSLPPMAKTCGEEEGISNLQIIYPVRNSIIYVPRELSGEKGKVVFEAAHRHPERTIFWSIDEEFIQKTNDFHQISVQPSEGKHLLILVDEKGERLQVPFEVIDR